MKKPTYPEPIGDCKNCSTDPDPDPILNPFNFDEYSFDPTTIRVTKEISSRIQDRQQ